MFSLQKTTKANACRWLALAAYVAAGLLAVLPAGHVHHHDHVHHDHVHLAVADDHAHEHAHGHAHDHEHAHHTHAPGSGEPSAPLHDDDCAGCRLLGCVAVASPVVELVEAGQVAELLGLLNFAPLAILIGGESLPRAPPAYV
jgi:hypothetical protein